MRARRGRVPGRARASAGCQGSSGVRIWTHREQGGAWRGGRTRGSNGARALLHGCHGDNSSSTWRASLCPTWGPFFGIFRADSDLGSSSKVALLRMVYKLGYGVTSIRSLEQQLISAQIASVNALTTITKLQKSMVKTRSNECHPFARSSSRCMLQLLFWDQVKLLNEIWRTQDANADVNEFRDLEYF